MKKLFTILISLILLLGLLPMAAYADGQSVSIRSSYNTTVNRNGSNYLQVVSKSNTTDGYKLVVVPQDDSITVKSGTSGVITSTEEKTTIYELKAANLALLGQHKIKIYAYSTEFDAAGIPLDELNTSGSALTSSAAITTEQGKLLQETEINVMVVDSMSNSNGTTAAATVSYMLSGGDYIYADEINTITVSFFNRGNAYLKGAELSITLPTGMTIQSGSKSMYVGDIRVNKTAEASFPIICDKTITDTSYPITATLKGYVSVYTDKQDDEGKWYSEYTGDELKTLEQTFYVPVKNGASDEDETEESDYATPRLMVSKFSCGGSVVAGKNFGLNLTILNTSKITLQNIKVTVTPEAAGMVPVGTSSSFFIDKLEAGETTSRAISFSTSRDTVQGYYGLAVDMSYEDTNKADYKSSDKVSVSVVQESRLEVDEILDPGWLTMSDQGYCSVSYRNLGNNDIKNLKLYVEGDFTMESASTYYVGTLASGKQNTYNFNFWPNQAGDMFGQITFVYEDADGSEHSLVKEFNFNIGEGYSYDEEEYVEPEDTGFQINIPTWGIILIAVAIVVIIFVIVKIAEKKKAKKEEELDLDE